MSAAPVSAAGCSTHLQSNILLTLEQSWTRAFIAQESTTAALHHEGSKDSSQCVFPTLLYIIKPSAEPRLTPQVSSSVLSREAGERHLNSLKLKREMSWWTGDCGFVLTQELLGQSATSQMRSGFMNCASPAINSFQGDKDTSKGLFYFWFELEIYLLFSVRRTDKFSFRFRVHLFCFFFTCYFRASANPKK